ncbi:MAG: peptide ABC transporter substrate-binding protein [Bdellovibrionales bacterium]|nr:peptide ABC transporter substrate-binding protein [Bdellovibrionales bacterium]
MSNTQDTLLTVDPKTGKLLPNAAQEYSISSDGKTIRFVLRDNLYFSNGDKILANDYAFGIKRHLDPKNKSAHKNIVSYIQGGVEILEGMFYHPQKVGVKALIEKNHSVLEITLSQAYPKILYFFAHPASMPIHQKSFDENPAKYFVPGHFHSSGAFIVSQKNKSLFVFAKNPHYRDQKNIALTQVQLSLFDQPKAAQRAFMKGKIDQWGSRHQVITDELIQDLKGSDVLFFEPDMRTLFIRFHTRKVPTGEFKIRQALSMAINREEIQKLALSQQERTAFSITPDQQHLYDPPHTYYYDLDGAKSILTQLGFCMGQDDRKQCLDLPRLEILFPKTLIAQKVVFLLQEQWKKLGFTNIDVKGDSPEVFVENINHGLFSIAIDEIAVDSFHFFDLLHAFESTQSTSIGVQSNAYDQLLFTASHALRWEDAVLEYRQAESFLIREASVVPLVQTTTPFVKATYVKGFEPNLWDLHPWKDIVIQ